MFIRPRFDARAAIGPPRARGLKTGLRSCPEALIAPGGEASWAEFSTPAHHAGRITIRHRGFVEATSAMVDARGRRAPTLPAAL